MKNLYLDAVNKDITLTNSKNIRFTSNNTEFISQKIENTLLFFFEEWFLNRDLGIPYFESILVKNPDLNLINSIFLNALYGISGITEVLSFSTVFNTTQRTYTANFTVKIENELIDGSVNL